MDEQITIIGETDFRSEKTRFGIKKDDRRRHMHIIGKTGMGKTALLENIAIQDIQNGKGVGFIDPHGESADKLLDFVPKSRIKDVIYFNPSDLNYPIGFNVMETRSEEERHLVASGLMSVFKKIWPDVWSPRMEYILNNTILALIEVPGMTLLGINRMLGETPYRKEIVKHLKDPVVKTFWINEFEKYSQSFQTEAIAPIQNKAGQFVTNPLIRNIIGQVKNKINMRQIMDEKKILIANLSKGKIGEDNSSLLGGLIITKLQLAAMSRVDLEENAREDFYLYVDEFQNFATESFINILSEARKYRLNLTLAHQYIDQLTFKVSGGGHDERLKSAIFGNVGTLVCFRVGAEDAEFLEQEFFPDFDRFDFVNLSKYKIYLRLMIDGVVSRPFSAATLPPLTNPKLTYRKAIITNSRNTYAVAKKEMDNFVSEWMSIERLDNEYVDKIFKQSSVKLYEALCSNCHKKTRLTFKPPVGRPVYCRKCYKKMFQEQNRPIQNKIKEFTTQSEKKEIFEKKPTSNDIPKNIPNKEESLKNLLSEALKMKGKK